MNDLIEIPATELQAGDCIVELKSGLTWQRTGYQSTPLVTIEREGGRVVRVGPNFGNTMFDANRPWMVRVRRAGVKPAMPATPPVKILAYSHCGKYGVILVRDVPADVKRSASSSTIEIAIRDETTDIPNIGGFIGPVSTYSSCCACWVALADLGMQPAFVANPEPVVLPCVDPLKHLRDAIFVREIATVEGIKGFECLTRFEKAQQTESIVRLCGGGYVSTNAECGLTTKQVEAAQDLWSYKLRLRVAEQRQRDEATRAMNLCDDPDEMPNMVYVETVE